MKFYTDMPASLKPFYYHELKEAAMKLRNNNFLGSWSHLERAHIIGQPYPYHHSLVHWKMLLFGIRMKDLKEIIGQIPRLIVGGVKSFVGEIPIGNTGGANVPPLRRMEIPQELKELIQKHA